MKACIDERQVKVLSGTTQEFPSGSGDYIMIVEEVKSTIQAR